ncbi:MAG: DUF1722 domain-containing protein [Acidobacteria bacterium]|nr:DUF1722 domain-containing protein [Acidobacteriota bacterium]
MSDRPRIGVSTCLLGETVRWDAGHKRDAYLVDVFGPQVEWVPFCPEVEAGFGAPRETMHLARAAGGPLILIDDHRCGRVPLIVPITLMKHHIRREGVAYLAGQVYLDPHPRELSLRNHV